MKVAKRLRSFRVKKPLLQLKSVLTQESVLFQEIPTCAKKMLEILQPSYAVTLFIFCTHNLVYVSMAFNLFSQGILIIFKIFVPLFIAFGFMACSVSAPQPTLLPEQALMLKHLQEDNVSEAEYRKQAPLILVQNNPQELKLLSKYPSFSQVVLDTFQTQLQKSTEPQTLTNTLRLMDTYKVGSFEKYALLGRINNFENFKTLVRYYNQDTFLQDERSYPLLLTLIYQHKDAHLAFLIQEGVSLKYVPNDQNSSLIYSATQDGTLESLKLLLAQPDVEVDVVSSEGLDALHYAIAHNKAEKLKLLISHYPDLSTEEILVYSFRHFHDETVAFLLRYFKESTPYIDKYDLLSFAAKKGHLEILKSLSAMGYDLNHLDRTDTTAIYAAVKYRQVESATFLMEHNVSLDPELTGGLIYVYAFDNQYARRSQAIHERENTIVKRLIAHGYSPNLLYGDNYTSALTETLIERRYPLFETLLTSGATVREIDIAAALSRNVDKKHIVMAINAFKSENITNKSNPLLNAIEYKDEEIIKMLIDKGFDMLGYYECEHQIPLHSIALETSIPLTEYALEHIGCQDPKATAVLSDLRLSAQQKSQHELVGLLDKKILQLKACQ